MGSGIEHTINNFIYRFKYRAGRWLPLSVPVDVALELASSCSMACSYCLSPDTLVLNSDHKWVEIKSLKSGDKIIGFDEENVGRANRKMRIAEVQKVWKTKKEAIKITTSTGSIICSKDHKFLDQSSRWVMAGNLAVGRKIKAAKAPWQTADTKSVSYKLGYIQGIGDGDGTVRWVPLDGATGKAQDSRRQVYWRVAMIDKEPLHRVSKYFASFGIEHPGLRTFQKSKELYKDMFKIEVRSKQQLRKLKCKLESADKKSLDYKAGYLAGIFDSEGSYSDIIRISQVTSNGIKECVLSYLNDFGFSGVIEERAVRLQGGVWEEIKFLGIIQPAIKRKLHNWDGGGVRHKGEKILSIEPMGEMDLIDIQTSSKTFYGGGFPTHNCYHSDAKELPFKRGFMSFDTAMSALKEMGEIGVNSFKPNYRGEATLHPSFAQIMEYAKSKAKGTTLIDRVINSNFKYHRTRRQEIFEGLSFMTKVKVSYDSFRKDVFETQRAGGDHELTTENIDLFYNHPLRKKNNVQLVIQAVRTNLNIDEDIEGLAKKRWPDALISIRDVVEGRVNKDVSQFTHRDRDFNERQSCIQAHVRLIVHHDGNVSPCCPSIKGDLLIGKFPEQSLKSIFNSQAVDKLRMQLVSGEAFEKDPCKTCSSWESFKGYKPNWNS